MSSSAPGESSQKRPCPQEIKEAVEASQEPKRTRTHTFPTAPTTPSQQAPGSNTPGRGRGISQNVPPSGPRDVRYTTQVQPIPASQTGRGVPGVMRGRGGYLDAQRGRTFPLSSTYPFSPTRPQNTPGRAPIGQVLPAAGRGSNFAPPAPRGRGVRSTPPASLTPTAAPRLNRPPVLAQPAAQLTSEPSGNIAQEAPETEMMETLEISDDETDADEFLEVWRRVQETSVVGTQQSPVSRIPRHLRAAVDGLFPFLREGLEEEEEILSSNTTRTQV
ncbi:hypothetical protein SAICODRAFT_29189 [Saitoella complicata NRRL Y-17804]|uniref:uncharacterized protein n=1 Tax=Saitoella complicata (strain BCRC 22490 / CBS 7301 / JCM 7358 / NBRC 10748 / NRRL Y-17804) TaxID=698492 RepID=UPI000866C7AF|nr:uncharacterized protein SAICODRAFT_29189 [Saitoella complicata NRRL Y-17804]ODQ54981.1 hypothetical protein SAICODRAFT_29189 [Saitoella complicata NRRL Y-17804]